MNVAQLLSYDEITVPLIVDLQTKIRFPLENNSLILFLDFDLKAKRLKKSFMTNFTLEALG